jgi:hypothetical protein
VSGRNNARLLVPSLLNSTLGEVSSEAEVLDWVHRALGPVEKGTEYSASGPNRVVQLRTRSGDNVVVKWFSQSQGFFRTLEALSNYCQPLGGAAPKLIDHSEGLRAILMTAVGGTLPSQDELVDYDVHFRLGEQIRLLHESSPKRRSSQWTSAIAGEISWLADTTESSLDPGIIQFARVSAMELLDLGPIDLVPTHGGLRLGHWLVDSVHGIQLVGFSSSDYEPWVVDTIALEQEVWGYSPLLKEAFLAGYGEQPGPDEAVIVRALQVRNALEGWHRVTSQRATKASRAQALADLDRAFGATLF